VLPEKGVAMNMLLGRILIDVLAAITCGALAAREHIVPGPGRKTQLPYGDRAILDIRKIEGYCLDPAHPRGRHKARVFGDAA
jgi:hypothetical protein